MKLCLAVVILLAFAPALVGGGDFETLTKDTITVLEETVLVCKTVLDKLSADAALPRLDERLAVLNMKRKPITEQQKQILVKHKETAGKAFAALVSEVQRIAGIPEASGALQDVFPFKRNEILVGWEQAMVPTARIQLKLIDTGLDLYSLNNNGQYPNSLKTLTTGAKPPLRTENLFDPWKQPYRYDAAGPKNGGLKPDVWTVTPITKKVIANWEAEKQ